MADSLSPAERSERMSRIRGKDTKPEMIVRRLVYGLGYRYRLHRKDLPGAPDLVFPGRRKVIFVHGCFWHRHDGCGRLPKSRLDFWVPKLEANRLRDRRHRDALEALGWNVIVVWECEMKDRTRLAERIDSFLTGREEGIVGARAEQHVLST
jgi:DNA mismatch endonuclease (patch repair protein)